MYRFRNVSKSKFPSMFSRSAIEAGQSQNSHNNKISNIKILNNTILNVAGPNKLAIFVKGATLQGGTNNLISGIEISKNKIQGHTFANIVITGGNEQECQGNRVENIILNDIDIVNNTITENGNSWAGGININSKDVTNLITGVRIINTILWNNMGYDSIRGSLSPQTVMFSIIADSRYADVSQNFYASPLFIDPQGMNYPLSYDSPAIDRGDNSVYSGNEDHPGYHRVLDGDNNGEAVVDIGAFEYRPKKLEEIQTGGGLLILQM
jgi:hypothetical protein